MKREIDATERERSAAARISGMARLPMYRRVLSLLVKIRILELELKTMKAEQRKQWGWQ